MAKTKGAGWATPAEEQMILKFLAKGWGSKAIAERIGRSPSFVYQVRKRHGLIDQKLKGTESDDFDAPKTWEELDEVGRESLRSLRYFMKAFFAMEMKPWQEDAANVILEKLANEDDRDYGVINMPPSAGKSTTFTLIIPAWLIAGGGVCDPQFGRRLRMLLGHESKEQANEYVSALRDFLALRTPFVNELSARERYEAEYVMGAVFGRFEPITQYGEAKLWQRDKFVVAQVGTREGLAGALYNKEPTVKSAGYGAKFVGTRVDYYVWDDLAASETALTAEGGEKQARWMEKFAETRLEPGGVGLLVGQRMSPMDIYGNRLKATQFAEDGAERPKYFRVIYPAHFEKHCDGDHRQWDPTTDDGCLLDSIRLKWSDLLGAMNMPDYRTVYLQEDSNPDQVLVDPAWISGGTDAFGFTAIGCWDRERHFWEWPQEVGLVTYAVVDPSVNNFWAVEVWALNPKTMVRSLIYGVRKRMNPGTDRGFIDWDASEQRHVGLMEELQVKSGELGHPIQVWIVEQNAAHKYLMRTNAFLDWQQKWPMVDVWPHETQKQKNDQDLGVWATIPFAYKLGLKRLPGAKGVEERNFLRLFLDEHTKYPFYGTDDSVMADWFGECNLARLVQNADRLERSANYAPPPNLPPYLLKQMRTVSLAS